MRLSIIIPTWNRKENLRQTLTCLTRQIIQPQHYVEIVVVDDCSTDGTTEMIDREFSHTTPYIFVTKTEHHGGWNASIPRNQGTMEASLKTEAFLFLDSDVLLPPDRVQRVIDDYLQDPEENRVIIGPYNYLSNKIDADANPDWYEREIRDYQQDVRWQSFLDHPVSEKNTGVGYALACFGGILFIPRQLFFKSGGYDEKVTSGCEDGEFGLTLWETGAVFSLDKALLSWHNPHHITESRTKDIPAMIAYIDKKHSMDIVKATGQAYRQWNIEWSDPRWEEAKDNVK